MVTTVGGHWELRAAALLKAVRWGMRLASLLTHLFLSHHTVVWGILSLLCFCLFVCLFVFVCTVADFSAAEKLGA